MVAFWLHGTSARLYSVLHGRSGCPATTSRGTSGHGAWRISRCWPLISACSWSHRWSHDYRPLVASGLLERRETWKDVLLRLTDEGWQRLASDEDHDA
jgi:hypothetical protein